jgi:four helix bundle protein
MYEDLYAHENLDIFQLAVDLVEKVYRTTDQFPREQEYRLTDQMQRAGISIISNFGEGASNGSTRQYIRYLKLARGSTGELSAQVIIARRLQLIDTDTYRRLRRLCKRVSTGISAIIRLQERRLS